MEKEGGTWKSIYLGKENVILFFLSEILQTKMEEGLTSGTNRGHERALNSGLFKDKFIRKRETWTSEKAKQPPKSYLWLPSPGQLQWGI